MYINNTSIIYKKFSTFIEILKKRPRFGRQPLPSSCEIINPKTQLTMYMIYNVYHIKHIYIYNTSI